MAPDHTIAQARDYRGEWVATSRGVVIAHGRDFREVAQEACRKACDIAFEHIPDPAALRWRPARPGAPPAPRAARGHPAFRA